MGNKKLLKLLIPLSLGAILMGAGNTSSQFFVSGESYNTAIEYESSVFASNRVIITNNKLNTTLRSMLDKNSTENMFSTDFMSHKDYAPTIINEGTPQEESIIPTYQLNFSKTGITDIRELAQFELPSNIKAIDLSSNNITKDDISKLIQLLDCKKGDIIKIGDIDHVSQTDFSSQIKKVNLNNNKINLNEISLSDTRLLFGIQNLPDFDKPIAQVGSTNPQIYIRENIDENFLTFKFQHELSTNIDKKVFSTTPYNQVVSLIDDNPSTDKTNKYYINIQSIDSETAYFSDYSFEQEFTLFDIYLDPSFTVQRKTLLMLDVTDSGYINPSSPLILKGFGNGNSVHISYDSESTQFLTTPTHKNYVDVRVALRDNSYFVDVQVEFVVVDTVSPKIKLLGTAHTYSSKNVDFVDPGVIAYDPIDDQATTGDDLTAQVIKTSNIDVTTIGKYYITYSVKDIAGNEATATRVVEIQQKALTTLHLRCNSEEIIVGEDVNLAVQLETGVDPNKYSSIKYYWYMDNATKPFMETTTTDMSTGLSSISKIIEDSSAHSIYVICKAVQKEDGATVEVQSNTITLTSTRNMSSNQSMILAVGCAVLIIIIIIAIITFVKYKKSHKKTHTKTKKKESPKGGGDADKSKANIQVIKDYNGTAPTQPQQPSTENQNTTEDTNIPQDNQSGDEDSSGLVSKPKDNSKFDPNDYK